MSAIDSPSILGSAMISILSSATSASVAVRRKKLRTPAKKSRTSCFFEGVLQRQHRPRVGDLGKAGGGRGADPARRAVGADQLREAGLDRGVAAAQRIVFGVGDLGRRIGVIEPVVMRDLLGQRARARPGPPPRSANRPAATRARRGAPRARSKRSCAASGDQARRRGARLGGDVAAGQHAGDLLLSRVVVELLDAGDGLARGEALGDPPVIARRAPRPAANG